jgi:putative two-component system response regulator
VSERILVVEDHPRTLDLLTRILQKEGFDVIGVANGEDALLALKSELPDLIFLDIMLTGVDGFDLCRAIKIDPLYKNISVIMCAAKDSPYDEMKEGKFGADDYITRPFNNSDLIARIRLHLRLRRAEEQLMMIAHQLQSARRAQYEHTRALERSRLDTINTLMAAVTAKDPYTSEHGRQVANLCHGVAVHMGFDRRSLENLNYASLLHDIGKIGVPKEVLAKENRLEREELEIIRRHPEISAEIIKPVLFLQRVVPIIRHHHENVDGSGYPDGLNGDEIPLESRILAVADAYDAMTSNRPYRDAISRERALTLIAERAGTQFDVDIVNIFTEVMSEKKESVPTVETVAPSLS